VTEAYPLSWPAGRPRKSWRERSRFDVSLAKARDEIRREVALLSGSASALVISSNLMLRQDGLPYANQRQPDDPGVAVYFTYKKRQMCFACDRWVKVEDNMQAIAKTINALRGVARWGTGDMMEAAFTGFTALPDPTNRSWRDVLGKDIATREQLETIYRRLRSESHPDKGGSPDRFHDVQRAYEQACGEIR
jgi:hypothetical protein